MFVCLDAFFQDLHAIKFGRIFGTDGSMATHVLVSDNFGTLGGVVCFYLLQFRMTLQEGMALGERYGM